MDEKTKEIMKKANMIMLEEMLDIIKNYKPADTSEFEILAQIERLVRVKKDEAKEYDQIKPNR